jgi:hypothetical protein
LIFNICIIGVLVFIAFRLWKDSDSLFEDLDDYSETDGKISEYLVDTTSDEGGRLYRLYLFIIYSVNGRAFRTSRYFLHSLQGKNNDYIMAKDKNKEALLMKARAHVGQTVTVKYKKSDELDAFVDSTLQDSVVMRLYVLGILFLAGIFFLIKINFF